MKYLNQEEYEKFEVGTKFNYFGQEVEVINIEEKLSKELKEVLHDEWFNGYPICVRFENGEEEFLLADEGKMLVGEHYEISNH